MAEPMTGTLSSTKYPFSPKNMYSMDVWKRAKSQVMSTGSINYVRLGYWRIVASHSDSTTGKRRQRKKCARPKKKQGTICKIINHSVPYRTTQSFISGSSDTFHLPETVPSAGLSRLQHLQDQQSLYICHQHLLHLKAKIPSHGLISP